MVVVGGVSVLCQELIECLRDGHNTCPSVLLLSFLYPFANIYSVALLIIESVSAEGSSSLSCAAFFP
jgi:hypothetical protein